MSTVNLAIVYFRLCISQTFTFGTSKHNSSTTSSLPCPQPAFLPVFPTSVHGYPSTHFLRDSEITLASSFPFLTPHPVHQKICVRFVLSVSTALPALISQLHDARSLNRCPSPPSPTDLLLRMPVWSLSPFLPPSLSPSLCLPTPISVAACFLRARHRWLLGILPSRWLEGTVPLFAFSVY